MGFERWWLPAAPKVKKPRSTYNAASLAYLGDCIYEVSLLPSIYLLSLGYVEISAHSCSNWLKSLIIRSHWEVRKADNRQICPSMMKPIHHSLVIYVLHFSFCWGQFCPIEQVSCNYIQLSIMPRDVIKKAGGFV